MAGADPTVRSGKNLVVLIWSRPQESAHACLVPGPSKGAETGSRRRLPGDPRRRRPIVSERWRSRGLTRRFSTVTIRVGINGFGRIGRNFWRAVNAADGDRGFEIVAANDLGDIATMAHLLKYDTVLGTLPAEGSVSGGTIRVGDKEIKILAERDPAKLPWRELGVDIVIESTGRVTTGPTAGAHLAAGAKKVIISAPAKDEDITIVMGVNDDAYDPEPHKVLYNHSC